MPQYAEQHFVPKFYLRNFSSEGRQLNLVNIGSEKVILGASLRKQCARTKFYDFDPDTEFDLGRLEAKTAPIIRQIMASDQFLRPDVEYEKYVNLVLFVVVQHVRGVRTANANDEMTDYYGKLMLQSRAEAQGIDLTKVKIGNKYPAALPLLSIPDIMPSAMTLRPHLIVNRSARDFVTSDDPVVLHNQYCEGIDYQGVLGWRSKGIQVFFPLSPRHLLVLFDNSIYRMGSRRSHLATEITSSAEVEQFNSMQVLHAVANIYFKQSVDADQSRELVRKLVKDRPKRAMTIVETEIVDKPDGTGSSLVHTFQPLLRCRLSVSAIRYQSGVSKMRLHDRGRMIGRPKEFWDKQSGGTRYEIAKTIGAYDEID